MSVFGKSQSSYMHDANKALDQGYAQEQAALSPYTKYSQDDFDKLRQSVFGGAKRFAGQPQYGKQFSQYLNMSPEQLMNQAMSGYKESDLTKMEKAASKNAMDNQELYSGMYGSGVGELTEAEIDDVLGVQGMGTYLKGIEGALKTQGSIYDRYAKKRGHEAGMLGKGFKDIIGEEYGASTKLGEGAMREAQQKAMLDERAGSRAGKNNMFRNLLGLGVVGAHMFGRKSGSGGAGSTSNADWVDPDTGFNWGGMTEDVVKAIPWLMAFM